VASTEVADAAEWRQGRRSRLGQQIRDLILLGPATAFYTVFFLIPLGLLAVYSFYTVDQVKLQITPAFSFSNYRAAASGSLYLNIVLRTVLLGLTVGVVVVVLAYCFAYIATFVFPGRRELLLFLLLASIFGGYLVRIYAWRTILGDQGLINSLLLWLGVVDRPVKFLLFSRFAVLITLVNFLLPFAVLPLYGALQNVPREVLESARDLGGGPLSVFRTILLPLTGTGIKVAFAFAFVLAAGDYVTPQLVGGTNGIMIGNVVADQFGVAYNWPLGAALAITTLLLVLLIFLAIGKAIDYAGR
jgi:spermidine/putrescine transport system permease protein